MNNAIELVTYRYIVNQMLEKAGYKVNDAEQAETKIRRYRIAHESARNCANAIIEQKI